MPFIRIKFLWQESTNYLICRGQFREFFSNSEAYSQEALDSACSTVTRGQILSIGQDAGLLDAELSSKVFHLHVLPNTSFKKVVAKYASDYVQQKIICLLFDRGEAEVAYLLAHTAKRTTLSTFHGTLFEPYCHNKLAHGITTTM